MEKYSELVAKMKIFPAIDIEGGHFVRLKQGNIQDITVYGNDPVKMALQFQEEGAQALHVVDLDGAFKGSGINTEIIRKMADALSVPIEVGGGIRTEEAIRLYLENGVHRAIIGSKAVASPYFAIKAAQKWGKDRIAVSLDAKGNNIATHGWVKESTQQVIPFARNLVEHGVDLIIYTDISRDGMLTGPNFEVLQELQTIPGIRLIASGGISSAEDLKKLSEMGVYGVITGKALYEGRLTMQEVRKIQES